MPMRLALAMAAVVVGHRERIHPVREAIGPAWIDDVDAAPFLFAGWEACHLRTDRTFLANGSSDQRVRGAVDRER